MSWNVGVLKNDVRFSDGCAERMRKYLDDEVFYSPGYTEYMVNENGEFCFEPTEGADFIDDCVIALLLEDGAEGEILFGDVEGRAGAFWGYRFRDGRCDKLKGRLVWEIER